MKTARKFLLILGLGLLAPAAAPVAEEGYAPLVQDDGMLTQPWFLESFLELQDDLAEAQGQGKRFAVFWEQRGCPYCKTMHTVNFADPVIRNYIKDNFVILQLNIYGSREVTDFDGEVLPEKELARKYGVAFTPTVQFFPDDPAAVEGKAGKEAEVARMPGYFEPPYFKAIFRFVRDKAYEQSDFLTYARKALQQSQGPEEDVKGQGDVKG